LTLDFGKIKKLYKEFRRDPWKYPKVFEREGEAIKHYGLGLGFFNQRPVMERVAAEFIDAYPDDALDIMYDLKKNR